MEKVFEVKNFSLCEKEGVYFICENGNPISKSYRYLASAVKKFWELVR